MNNAHTVGSTIAAYGMYMAVALTLLAYLGIASRREQRKHESER